MSSQVLLLGLGYPVAGQSNKEDAILMRQALTVSRVDKPVVTPVSQVFGRVQILLRR